MPIAISVTSSFFFFLFLLLLLLLLLPRLESYHEAYAQGDADHNRSFDEQLAGEGAQEYDRRDGEGL